MKSIALLMVLAFSACAQSPVDKPSDSETVVDKKVDPKLHADAIKLVEVSGAKQRIQDSLEKTLMKRKKR